MKFGDQVRGIYASEDNLQRDGTFVRECIRQGQRCAEVTNEKGDFWCTPIMSLILLAERDALKAQRDALRATVSRQPQPVE